MTSRLLPSERIQASSRNCREIDANLKSVIWQSSDSGRKSSQLREEQTHQRDRDSARRREAAVKDSTPRVLAYGITASLIALTFCVFFFADRIAGKSEVVAVVTALATGLLTGLHQALSFYFGSSKGSETKNDAIHSGT